MKKTLITLLAILTIASVSLAACGKDGNGDDSDTTPDDLVVPDYTGTVETTSDTEAETTTEPVVYTWETKSDTVYVLFEANLRKEPSMSATAIDTAKYGKSLSRVAVSSDGSWNKVLFDGVECYIYAPLTTNNAKEVTFTEVDDKEVYINVDETMFLRTTPCYYDGFEANLGEVVKRGDKLIQTGINEEGNWARVELNGKTYYCRPRYLSDSVPSESDTPEVTVTPAG